MLHFVVVVVDDVIPANDGIFDDDNKVPVFHLNNVQGNIISQIHYNPILCLQLFRKLENIHTYTPMTNAILTICDGNSTTDWTLELTGYYMTSGIICIR